MTIGRFAHISGLSVHTLPLTSPAGEDYLGVRPQSRVRASQALVRAARRWCVRADGFQGVKSREFLVVTRQPNCEVGARKGTAEIEALGSVTAERVELVPYLLRFDPLRGDGQPEAVSELNRRGDDGGIVGVVDHCR